MFYGFKSRSARQKYYKKWNKRNKHRTKKYAKKWYLNNRDRILKREKSRKVRTRKYKTRRLWRSRNRLRELSYGLKAKYDMSLSGYRKMFKHQKGRCAICGKKESMRDSNTGKIRLLCVDHNHKTKKIRKLLCWHCNLGIGIFKDDWRLLQIASRYLKTNKGTR